MADRYQSDDRSRRERGRRAYGRQDEQFQPGRGYNDDPDYGQMGGNWRSDFGEQESGWHNERQRERDFGAFDRSDSYGQHRYARAGRGSPGGDFGARDYGAGMDTRGSGRSSFGGGSWDAGHGAGSQLAANHGEWREGYGATPSREHRDYRGTWGGRVGSSHEDGERGFLERAGDTLAGWLGDETVHGREGGHRGRGPANYTRSDDRIREDVCDALTDDWHVDASEIQVSVENGEVTLNGTVASREQKRRAEDCVENRSGIRHVQNNLRVQDSWSSGESEGKRSSPVSSKA